MTNMRSDVAEAAWILRRGRELNAERQAGREDPAAHVEFYARKAHLMERLGEIDLAETAWIEERRWRAQLVGPLV